MYQVNYNKKFNELPVVSTLFLFNVIDFKDVAPDTVNLYDVSIYSKPTLPD